MLLLAFDTATPTTTVALLDAATPISENTLSSTSHSRSLLPAIAEILSRTGHSPRSLQAIAVGRGPGSFTGVRIGMTLAKTLAYALDIPLVGVSTLRALAHNAAVRQGGLVCPALDALKGEVYGAVFRYAAGGLETVRREAASDPRAFAGSLKAAGETCTLLGSGAIRYRHIFTEVLGDALRLPEASEAHEPRAAVIGQLAWERLSRGEPDDRTLLEPDYCRPSEAELKKR